MPHRQKNKLWDDIGDTLKGTLGDLNQRSTAIERLNARPYDGVSGKPPEWLPAPLQHEFSVCRDRLLALNSVANVRKWVDARRNLTRSATDTGPVRDSLFFPPEHARDLESLIYIQDIASLDQNKGIEAYLGEGTTRVLRGAAVAESDKSRRSKGGKRRKELQLEASKTLVRGALNAIKGAKSKLPINAQVVNHLAKSGHTISRQYAGTLRKVIAAEDEKAIEP